MKGFHKIACLVLSLTCAGMAKAQDNADICSRSFICYRADRELSIDGKLDDNSWAKVPWSVAFVDIEGTKKPAPLYPTRMKMLWDDHFLYIGAELKEPNLWATLTKRESIIFRDNDFEVFIDPDGDTHNYYEIEINALNTVWDLRLVKPYRDGGPALSDWNIEGMKTAVHLNGTLNNPADTDSSWTVEMAMPWDALKEYAFETRKPRSGEQWRINFSRVEWRLETSGGTYAKVINPQTGKPYPEFNWVWAPQGVINMHRPETWGYVQFSDRVAGVGSDNFSCKPSEKIKWFLRELYYRENDYKKKHNQYSSNPGDLNLGVIKEKYGNFVPQFTLTPSGYEISVKTSSGSVWKINDLGKVWNATVKKSVMN